MVLASSTVGLDITGHLASRTLATLPRALHVDVLSCQSHSASHTHPIFIVSTWPRPHTVHTFPLAARLSRLLADVDLIVTHTHTHTHTPQTNPTHAHTTHTRHNTD